MNETSHVTHVLRGYSHDSWVVLLINLTHMPFKAPVICCLGHLLDKLILVGFTSDSIC